MKLLIFNVLFLFFTTFLNEVNGQINVPSPFPDRIVLNLTEEPNSVAVTWRTDTSVSEGLCELHPLTGGRIIPENVNSFKAKTTTVKYEYKDEPAIEANQHSVFLSGLIPGSKYLYRVGSNAVWSEWIEFKVPSNSNDSFSFVYFGDPQADIKSQWSRVIRKAYNTVPDCAFMLYGGDIINRAGRDLEWEEWFEAGSFIYGSVPQVLTPGNHDYNDLQLDLHWKHQFAQPLNGPKEVKGTCFFIDYKNLKIISIDSAVESELEDENGSAFKSQKAWLDSVLSVNTKQWVVLTTHLPFYSSKETRDNPLIRKHFQPILEKYNVDLVLNGHDHSYGRGIASDNPDIKPSVMYVVSVSGPKLYEAGNKDWMQFKGGNIQLFHEITIEENKLNFKAFTADGELFDQFSLKKNENGKKKFTEMNKNAVK
ncbi:MAG TPA: metallophosphoesterase family protein [Draconibacterium sp.]|nr:metallophosphoesterase family protein [Draconibacterium sp.]